MKNLFLFVLCAVGLSANSQPENTVPLADLEHGYAAGSYTSLLGDTVSGEIYHSEVYPNYFFYRLSSDEKAQKIKADSVSSIQFDDGLVFLSMKGTLVIKVNTENKIGIYRRFHAPGTLKKIQGANIEGKYEYLVTIEGVLELTSINSMNKLKPIHKRVPPLLEACPDLGKKIKNKEKGYKPTLMNPTLDVWKRIAAEYENCN